MNEIFGRLLGSTRFWTAVVMIAVPILNKQFGWNLDGNEILGILVGGSAYVVGQSIRKTPAKQEASNEPA